MIINYRYSKIFYSDGLTSKKYNQLKDLSSFLLERKNAVSKEVFKDAFKYYDYSKFDFLKEMRSKHKEIPSSFDYQLYTNILDCYKIRIDGVIKNLKMNVIKYVRCETYKINSKLHKIGDFKGVVSVIDSKSDLSVALTYLCRYGTENTECYIKERFDSSSKNQQRIYSAVIRLCDKFGYERLYNLALLKRDNILKQKNKEPITFNSTNFKGRSRKEEIIKLNDNKKSNKRAFVFLSGLNKKGFVIPVKYSRKYHGDVSLYHKPNPDYEYEIAFDEKYKRVKIILCVYGKKKICEPGNNIIGIDVNLKHNLFALSDGTTYCYDKDLMLQFAKFSYQLDKIRYRFAQNGIKWKKGKRNSIKIHSMMRKMKYKNRDIISRMCKRLQSKGINHIVMEDLDNRFASTDYRDHDNELINYNRKSRFLNVGSIKSEVKRIANKYGIGVSFVQSYYTSKCCSECGCIDDGNRTTQERFKCVECGHKENADINAAKNIRNRVFVTVLRDKLLKQSDDGSYVPIPIKKEDVKKFLLSSRNRVYRVE